MMSTSPWTASKEGGVELKTKHHPHLLLDTKKCEIKTFNKGAQKGGFMNVEGTSFGSDKS